MAIGLGLVSFAFGAILAFAIRSDPSGISLDAVGIIFMLVGAIAFGTGIYRDRWRRRIVEESIENGVVPPVSVDDDVIVEPAVYLREQEHVAPHEHVVIDETTPYRTRDDLR